MGSVPSDAADIEDDQVGIMDKDAPWHPLGNLISHPLYAALINRIVGEGSTSRIGLLLAQK
jgi:hypothetical protein